MRIVPKEPAQLASTARISTPCHARVRLSPGRQADRGVQVDPRLVCNVHTGSTMVRWRTSTIDRRHHVIEAESIWRCKFGVVLQYFDTITDGCESVTVRHLRTITSRCDHSLWRLPSTVPSSLRVDVWIPFRVRDALNSK